MLYGVDAFLLVAGESAIFVAFKARKFSLKSQQRLVHSQLHRRDNSYLCWLRRSCSASPVGLISDSLATVS